jgi:hypothetical protein
MVQTRRVAAHLWRIGVCCAVAIGTGAATWIDPPPADEAQVDRGQGSRIEAAPRSSIASNPQSDDKRPLQVSAPQSGIEVTQWRFSDRLPSPSDQPPQNSIAPRRPLYLWIALAGKQAAIDGMRANHRLTIEVHWVRETSETGTGAPSLVTELTIGRPGLAETLEEQVRRRGFFEWHSWARKDTLSPGTYL